MAEQHDPAPSSHIWHTAIGRSDFAFRSMLYSNDGPFFLSVDHLEAVVRQRQRLSRLIAIFFFLAIAISFVLLLKTSDLTISVQTPVGEVAGLPISTNVLLFALSVTTAYYVLALLNQTLLNKQIYAIFEHSGLPRNEAMSRAHHASARWSADQLWVDVLNIHTIGFRSGITHGVMVVITMLLLLFMAISQLTIILIATYAGLESARDGNELAYYFVALPSAFGVHFAIVGFLIAVALPMKFKWTPRPTSAIPSASDPSEIKGGPAREGG